MIVISAPENLRDVSGTETPSTSSSLTGSVVHQDQCHNLDQLVMKEV